MARLYLLLCLCLWQLLTPARAASPLQELAYLQDPEARLSVEQVQQARFQPYEGTLGLGFQLGPIWIRLTLAPAGEGQDEQARRRILRVGPNYLARIELHTQPEAGGPWSRALRGALTPEASRHCPDDRHCFELQAAATEPRTVYLRIEHPGFLAAQVEVLTPEALPFAVAERTRGLTTSLVVGLGLLGLALALLVADRSLLLLAYCCFQLVIVLFIASNSGVLARVLPQASGEALTQFNTLLFVLRGAATGFLAWAFLRPYRPSRLYQLCGQVLLLLCAGASMLIGLGLVQTGLKGSLLVISLIPFWHLLGTLTARDMRPVLRTIMLAGTSFYTVMLVMGLWLAFGNQAVVPKSGLISQIADWRLNGFAVGTLFFLVTLLERTLQKRSRAQEMETLRHQALEARARQAELDERTGLIDMLTHELKNPIGTIRFAAASLRQSVESATGLKRVQSIDLSARRMDDLIERVANFSKMERSARSEEATEVDLDALLQELLPDVSRQEQWESRLSPGARLRCDRQLLWVILENLVTNADKYALPGTRKRIKARLEGATPAPPGRLAPPEAPGPATLCIEVSNLVDPGSVPEAAHVFERYYRHPSAQGQAGMGLGLSVARAAAHKLGGELAYRYERGRVFFTLRVPA